MIEGKKILGLIPARGGSKGIPRKNIRRLGDKPLIAWTILEASKSKYIDRLIISTDDKEIAEEAQSWGAEVPFMRPKELATDTARGIDVVLHSMEQNPGFDAVVLLQPTSPFRLTEDIDCAIEQWNASKNTVVGVTEVQKSPYWMYKIENGMLCPIIEKNKNANNRQELEPIYVLNGAVYVSCYDSIRAIDGFVDKKTEAYIMPIERSIDIDSEFDWDFAEFLLCQSSHNVDHKC